MYGECLLQYDGTDYVLIDKTPNIPQKSFYFDIDADYGNVKTIDDFQDVSLWTVGAGTQSADASNVKIGRQSLKLLEPDAVAGSLYSNRNNMSLDLTKLNNGEVSGDDDYINLVFYVSDVSKVASMSIRLEQNATYTETNYKRYDMTPASLVTGWNFIKIKKSAFSTIGTGAWSGIQSMRIIWVSTVDALNAYVSFQLIQLVKKDPVSDYPNPFQKNGVRELAINSGEWFVGKEFGRTIVREFVKNPASNSLTSVTEFEAFTASARVSCQSNTRADLFTWANNTSNYLLVMIRDDMFRLGKVEAGVFTPVEVSYPINIGDVLTCTMQKNGSSVVAKLENQNGEIKTLKLTTTLSGKGKFALNQNGATYLSTIISASITEYQHAHHADIAEVAKGLTEQPIAIVKNNASQSLISGSTTALTFATITKDNRGQFDSTSPTRITIRETGLYTIHGNARFAINSTGRRTLQIRKGGSTIIASVQGGAIATYATDLSVSTIAQLAVGDYIELVAIQESGGALNVESQNDYSAKFSIAKIG